MANQFAAPPINPLISVQPLNTPQAGRDAPEVPSSLANLPNGTTVEGFVVNRDAQNNPILRTPVGDVLIKSDFFLKTGSVVVFRVDNTQASRARILTVDGLTPSDYVAQQSRVPQTDTIEQSLMPPANAASEEAQESAPKTIPTSAPPLKAVLVAPASTAKIDLPVPSTSAGTPAPATVPQVVLPEDPTPVPLILAKLQAGALLKVTVLKVELPAVIPTTTTPTPAIATPQLVPTTPGTPVVNSPSPRALAQPVMTAPLPQTVTPAARPMIAPIPADAVSIPIAPAQLPPVTPTQVQAPAPVIIPPLPANAATAFETPVLEAVPIQQTSIPPIPPAAIQPEQSALANLPRATPAAGSSAYQTATTRTPPLPQAPVQPLPANPAPAAQAKAPIQFTPYVPPNAPKPVSAPVFHAVVIGQEMDGATILHTRVGTLKTYLPQPLPTGTQLTVQMEPTESTTSNTPAASTPLSDSMENITTIARDWKSLTEAVQWLQVSDPTLYNQITQQLPNIGPRFTSGLLFFIAAIKGGDMRAWLGNRAVNALESKAPELLAKLRGDASQLQQLATESSARNWQMAMLPVMVHGQLEQARLFYRQEDEPKEEGKKGGSRQHRFIIEVDLSHIGSLQFDGFVRDGKQKRVFDLIIRSARPLVETVSADIRNLFDNALQTTGYRGYLTFQQGSQHFVRPLAELTPDGDTPQPILA